MEIDQRSIRLLLEEYGLLGWNPSRLLIRLLQRLDLKHTEYSRMLGKYPEYLNNRLNRHGSRPISYLDIMRLKDMVKIHFAPIKFEYLLNDVLFEARMVDTHKTLSLTYLSRELDYANSRIEELENQIEELLDKID